MCGYHSVRLVLSEKIYCDNRVSIFQKHKKMCIDAYGLGQFDRLKSSVWMQLMRQVVSYR
jgi:hypothetical protein